MTKHIAIFTDDAGWHGAELHKAFLTNGLNCTNVSLTDCRFEIGTGRNSLLIPGFEER